MNILPQWTVTRWGINGVDGYDIDAFRLLVMRDELYEWPLHLAEKQWVDLDEFEPVFRAALERFFPDYDRDVFAASFQAARKIKTDESP